MGKSYKEILKVDKNIHPEKHKFNKKTHKYEPTDITQKETIRKRFQRLEAFLREMDRDRKSVKTGLLGKKLI